MARLFHSRPFHPSTVTRAWRGLNTKKGEPLVRSAAAVAASCDEGLALTTMPLRAFASQPDRAGASPQS
jgi:hypothetical protein